MFAELFREHEFLFVCVGVLSGVTFVGTLIGVPLLVSRLPADYFIQEKPRPWQWERGHPVWRIAMLALKNLVGIVFLVLGTAMLVLPGQGLVTILLGITFLNFPGKRSLERRVVGFPPLLRAVNWLRRRAGRPPLRLT